LNTGLGDGISRLVLQLLLLYIQQSSLQRAKQRVQEALDLLPNLMNPTDTLSRYLERACGSSVLASQLQCCN